MELIGFIQVFNIIVIAIGTLFYMCCISLTFSSSSSSSSSAADSAVADSTAVADDDDAYMPPRGKRHHVFISFRGKDTRNTFTSHLYKALVDKKIETYIDDRLVRGEKIKPALLEAIEKSTLWVIIFSEKYATSAWCLDELVHIIECNKSNKRKDQFVIPIFYHTDVSDVRHQKGSYAAVYAQHQSIDKVDKWKEALTDAADIAGFPHPKNAGTDADLVKKIVEHIWSKLSPESSCDLKGLVGIESRIEQVESLLGIHSKDACITVGIWGMGGIGKTTLAKAVFDKHSSNFEAYCFLENVRENSKQASGLDRLEKTLLKEILKEEVLPVGSTLVRDRLKLTKVLVVLDDVSDSRQIESLVGYSLRFGSGSRIIITTRDRSTLRQTIGEDKIYEVKGLNLVDAFQLFCSRAFKNSSIPKKGYKGLAKRVVDYAERVPFALIYLGSLFSKYESKRDWEEVFNKLKRSPRESIQKELRISYNGLYNIEKEVLLDIACFHKGWAEDVVERTLNVRGFYGRTGIRSLNDMSLISIDSKWGLKTIEMLDLIQEMGRTIVQEQCKKAFGRNRLFTDEDVYDVLNDNTGTPIVVEAIFANWSKIQKIQKRPLECANFKVMSNLIMLIGNSFQTYDLKFTASLYLPDSLNYFYWWGYPLKSLPSNFSPERIVELHMPFSKVEKLWKEDQILVNLEVINLYASPNLTQVPNLYWSTKIVDINLHGCVSLVEIPPYFEHLDKLTRLDIGGCTGLKYLPLMPRNIEYLNLRGCFEWDLEIF